MPLRRKNSARTRDEYGYPILSSAERAERRREMDAFRDAQERRKGQMWRNAQEADAERRGRRLNPSGFAVGDRVKLSPAGKRAARDGYYSFARVFRNLSAVVGSVVDVGYNGGTAVKVRIGHGDQVMPLRDITSAGSTTRRRNPESVLLPRALGSLLGQWHNGADAIYSVSSHALAGRPLARPTAERALAEVETLLEYAKAYHLTAADKQQLKRGVSALRQALS